MEYENDYYHIISKFLNDSVKDITRYLNTQLPEISNNWWVELVLTSLSHQQKERITRANNTSLEGLDLAALLRVFDGNWYGISSHLNLAPEMRHYVKEMQTVRNRWSHVSSVRIADDDIYRDLDTLQRFLILINSDNELIERVKEQKGLVLGKAKNQEDGNSMNINKQNSTESEFTVGQIVRLKANPDLHGAVVVIKNGQPENRYSVFINGEVQTYYASQLDVLEKEPEYKKISADEFHALLTALQIRFPNLSTLYSLNSARIDFIPYQFRPVLKFIRSDRPRLLIADSVGVGKTIEAGLILRELQARRDIKSVLIICPRPLVVEEKWLKEMKRFDERFTQLNSALLRHCISETNLDGVWPEQHNKTILPYSLFDETLLEGNQKKGGRTKIGLLNLDPPPRFDMVIVDEAHHIRNQNTFRHKAVKFFCDNAEAVVFLTATPVQLGSHDLFVLLNTLRPDLIIDQESFTHLAEPNAFINQAVSSARNAEQDWQLKTQEAMKEAANTAWGQSIMQHNPEYIRIITELANESVTPEQRVQMITEIENLHTFSSIINRTRRRDIGNFTLRKPETVMVEFTLEQSLIHDELLNIQAKILTKLHGDTSINFMMSTIRRQAASCIFGLVPFLNSILSRHLDEFEVTEYDDSDTSIIPDNISAIQDQIDVIVDLAKQISEDDPKLEALRKIIADKQHTPNNKLMLFSSFRHTLKYIYENLVADGFRVGLIHGGVHDDERLELRRRFELPKEDIESLDIVLFSEIGCEGLDYQFCDAMVNYDLPWNPMRIEQRIGRIDRNGQKSEKVVIYNLITPGTIDADIYERCLMRIGVFNNTIGAGEEILGEITKEIKDIAENLSLNEEERRARLQQLSDNKIRLIQEQNELEQKQLELFGILLPQNQMKKEIESASSYWLTSSMLEHLINRYLITKLGLDQEFILGEKELKTLRLSQEARALLLKDLHQLILPKSSVLKEWEDWLKGGNQHLNITFDSQTAMINPKAVLINPIHPLIKQAAHFANTEKNSYVMLKVSDVEVPAGSYEFVIYQWQLHGIRSDLILKPITTSDVVTNNFTRLLEKATDIQTANEPITDNTAWENLEETHYSIWKKARDEHKSKTIQLSAYQKESLNKSHNARMALLEEQLSQSTDEKIQRMRRSQITNAEADFARRVQDLDIAVERAEITAGVVMHGILTVEVED